MPESDAPEGELDVTVIQQAVYPLRDQASACLLRADARGAAGGKLSIALRIGPDGRVSTACIEANETEDDALSACVLEVMSTLVLPKPSPSGEVDLSLPLVLRQINTPAQAPVCRPTE